MKVSTTIVEQCDVCDATFTRREGQELGKLFRATLRLGHSECSYDVCEGCVLTAGLINRKKTLRSIFSLLWRKHGR